MADAALLYGVSPADTFHLSNTLNTETEAKAFAERFKDSPVTVILVTSALHMHRAVWWFNHYGVKVIPAPCNYFVKEDPDDPDFEWWPSYRKIEMMEKWGHEVVGMWWAKWKTAE